MEITAETIKENINDPETLEDLYRSDKKMFSAAIKKLREQDSNMLVDYWHARLFYKSPKGKTTAKKYIFTACLIIFAWIPLRLNYTNFLDFNIYLIEAIPIVISFSLSLFFLIDSIKIKNIVINLLPHAALYTYMALLPNIEKSQPLGNILYFSPVLLWFFILCAYSNYDIKKPQYAAFLEKTGEVIVWSTMLIIGGGILVALSLSLFHIVNINASDFYLKNIATLGLAASPFVSLLIIENNNKARLSVLIANIFLPLILISIFAFGVGSLVTRAKPYEDRDIFILYNIMMVIVVSVLVYTGINSIKNRVIAICSSLLPVITVVLDIVTISAVIYRLAEYGVTANKITLLGTNIAMLGHLIYMIYLRFKRKTENNIKYLPVYFFWALCVVFVFPFVF